MVRHLDNTEIVSHGWGGGKPALLQEFKFVFLDDVAPSPSEPVLRHYCHAHHAGCIYCSQT
jgi:hypothetical protein